MGQRITLAKVVGTYILNAHQDATDNFASSNALERATDEFVRWQVVCW